MCFLFRVLTGLHPSENMCSWLLYALPKILRNQIIPWIRHMQIGRMQVEVAPEDWWRQGSLAIYTEMAPVNRHISWLVRSRAGFNGELESTRSDLGIYLFSVNINGAISTLTAVVEGVVLHVCEGPELSFWTVTSLWSECPSRDSSEEIWRWKMEGEWGKNKNCCSEVLQVGLWPGSKHR